MSPYQFRIGTLMIAVAVAGVVCAFETARVFVVMGLVCLGYTALMCCAIYGPIVVVCGILRNLPASRWPPDSQEDA